MITNVTTNKIVSKKEILCKTTFQQARGLMFRSKKNLIMEFKEPKPISLHMFFVFYPIDVILLNENKEVIEIKENFKQFTFWQSENQAKYVIELARKKSKNKIKIKDKINF